MLNNGIPLKNLVIFASGSGSNAEKIFEYFKDSTEVFITHIFCNNMQAGVISRAERLAIPCTIFSRAEYKDGTLLKKIQSLNTDWVILAGFLWLIPSEFIQAYPQRIVNLHPALLPKFGGKGMYGHFVHEAVVEVGEKESGITIHFVNELYDEGGIIFQSSFPILPTDTAADVAKKGQILEHSHFPEVIAKLVID